MAPTSWTGKDMHNQSSDICVLQKSVDLYRAAPQVTSFLSNRALTSLLTHPSRIPLIPWNSFDLFFAPPGVHPSLAASFEIKGSEMLIV